MFSAYVHADWDREAAGTDETRRKGRPEPDLRERAADAGSVLKGVRHYRHTQMCFDRRARLMVCDADHVERSPVSPTITVPDALPSSWVGVPGCRPCPPTYLLLVSFSAVEALAIAEEAEGREPMEALVADACCCFVGSRVNTPQAQIVCCWVPNFTRMDFA